MSVLGAGKAVLRGVYGLHKKAAVRPGRVTVISRQSNTPSADILLLKEALEKNKGVEVRVLCKTLDGGLFAKAGYLCHMIGPQMRALATSEAVVLDSYCIAASILNHKKDLTVIQMWHAMGALKKFGRSILGQEEGSSRALAEALDMHRGYDRILVSSEACLPYFAEAFGYDESRFWILPLPRTDILRSPERMAAQKEKILAAYPELSGKRVILYAPTMRKTEDDITKPLALAREVQSCPDTVLLLSPHPVMQAQYRENRAAFERLGALFAPEFSTPELLSVCDDFVSDYSAAIFEAAVAEKPIYLYTYDIENYLQTRGFYIDFEEEMPGKPCREAAEVMREVAENTCDIARIKRFSQKYVSPAENATEQLAARIMSLLSERK